MNHILAPAHIAWRLPLLHQVDVEALVGLVGGHAALQMGRQLYDLPLINSLMVPRLEAARLRSVVHPHSLYTKTQPSLLLAQFGFGNPTFAAARCIADAKRV